MIITMCISNNNAVINNNNNNNNNNNGQLKDLILPQHVSSKTVVSPGPVTVTTLNYNISCQYNVQLMEGHTLVISAIFPPILITIKKTFKV
jgi:hypothetical protein